MDVLLQQVVNAVSLGGTYALLALGLAVVFSVLGLLNFAHGEIMTVAGYALLTATLLGLPFGLGAVAAVFGGLVVAVLLERVAFRPVRGSSGATLLLTSFAVSQIVQVLLQNGVSARGKAVPVPAALASAVTVAGVRIGRIQLLAIAITAICLAALTYFLKATFLGTAMRAAAEDFETTRLMGVRADGLIVTSFAISGALAGIAGYLWVAQRGSVDPLMGFLPVLKAFVAVVIGGLGSLSGAVAGGFLLGAIEVLFQAYLPPSVQPYRDAFTLGLVIAILVALPDGLLARRTPVKL